MILLTSAIYYLAEGALHFDEWQRMLHLAANGRLTVFDETLPILLVILFHAAELSGTVVDMDIG